MIAKMIMATARDSDAELVANGDLLAKKYLERGWKIVGVLPGASMKSAWFVVVHDSDDAEEAPEA